MARASPGRYSLHDFAKNVYDVSVIGPDGAQLTLTRPDPSGWTVAPHPATEAATSASIGKQTRRRQRAARPPIDSVDMISTSSHLL